MTDLRKIYDKLTNDLQEIAKSYIVCFGHKKVSNQKDPILNWISFAIRLIEPKEREVHFSKGFWNRVPEDCLHRINRMVDKFEYGCDVNPYLSKSLKKAFSGKKTDLLWTDWEIHHFHLNEEISRDSGFSERSDYILFAIVGDDFVCFLDVKKHPLPGSVDFADPELYKIICDSWPDLVDDLNDITPDKDWSKEEITQFRKRGLNVCYSHNRKAKALGGIYSVSGKPIRTVFLRDKIDFELRNLSERIIECTEKEYANFSENDYSLKMDPDGLKLFSALENSCVPLPSQTINELFNKKWLASKLHNKNKPE